MNTPLVTVLIDTYNYGQYLEQAIDSALAQDFPPDQREIVVVDDGSTDDTPERVKKYGDAIRYLQKANGGQASAFNFGFQATCGEIIVLLDGDDYWLPGKLRRTVEEFEKNPGAGMVYHAIRQYTMENNAFEDCGLAAVSGFLPSNTKDLLSYTWYPTSFLAFRRSAIQPLLPIPEGLTIQADAYLSALIIFLTPIVALRECLAVYRVHGQNLFAGTSTAVHEVNERRERRLRTRRVLIDSLKAWLTKHGHDLNRPDLYALSKQWELTQEKDEFTARAPTRLRLCRHLWQYARFYGPRMTWRHRAVSYINAAGALLVGYKNIHRMDEWRVSLKRMLRSPAKLLQKVR